MDHETPLAYHKAGEEVLVTKDEYDYLMAVYMERRAQEVQAEHAAEEVLNRIKRAMGSD
jgi:hypothetical protein